MDKYIGKLDVFRDSPDGHFHPEVTGHRLVRIPEYKRSKRGEKILLFTCVNSSGIYFVAISTASTKENNETFKKIKDRIKALSPFVGGKCGLNIGVQMQKPYAPKELFMLVGLTSDLTGEYKYRFTRNEERGHE